MMEVLGPILLLLGFVLPLVGFRFMESDYMENKRQERAKKKHIAAGGKSEAYIQGYVDMANSLSKENTSKLYLRNYGMNCAPRYEEGTLKILSRKYDHTFNPSFGRISEKYMTSEDSQEFQDYFAGGIQLLADVDEYQGIQAEKDRLFQMRIKGLEDSDRRIIEAKKELTKLRNKTFNSNSEKESFDIEMAKLSKNNTNFLRKLLNR